MALVAVLLGATGTALAQSGFLQRRVTRGMARAVCVVSAGDCWRDREPCVVDASSKMSSLQVGVAIVRVGKDRVAVVERRSDGTFAVTLEGAWKGGLAASAGTPHVTVHLAGLDSTAGGAVTASLLAQLGDGRTWIVGSEAEAEALVASGGGDAGRAPDFTYNDRAWLSTLGASLGVGTGSANATAGEAQVAFDQHWGTATDARTGHHTTSIHASWSAGLSALQGALGVSAGADGPVIAIETDAAGRPLDLRVTTSGAFAGSRDLPGAVQPVAGLLSSDASSGSARRFEVTAHLDLTEPRALAAARALIDAIDSKHARATPDAELRQLLDERATIEARVLTDRASADDHGLSGGAGGVQLGLESHTERHDRQLLAASSRGLDGQWITRTDCVA